MIRDIEKLENQTVRVYTYSTAITGTLERSPMYAPDFRWWSVKNENAKVTFSKAQVLYCTGTGDIVPSMPTVHIVDKR